MDLVATTTIRRTIRYIEWTLLGVGVFLIFFNASPNTYISQPLPFFAMLSSMAIIAGMSFVLPFNAPMRQRQLYVALNILAVLFPYAVGARYDILLYIVLAKSSLLLSRRDALITAISTGITVLCLNLVSLPKTLAFMRTHASQQIAELNNTAYFVQMDITNQACEYIAASSFVILFSFLIVEEQKSRRKAEHLTLEVEALAATLERTRIAREIHDSLGHSLTTLHIQLELAQRLAGCNPQRASKSIDTAYQLASQCLSDVRRSVQTIRQQKFDLVQAINSLVQQVQQNQSFRVQLALNLPSHLPLHLSHQLYCVLQEGFTNIQKYAQAQKITLKIDHDRQEIALELRDNGIGFDPQSYHTGFGLRGIKERIQLLGGHLEIKSELSQGTQIRLKIPYDSSVISG